MQWNKSRVYSYFKDANHPQSSLNPWAFIQVCNEKPTLKQSLSSIAPAFSRGIIVYNECSDGSDRIIKEFCKTHTGFIAVEYPYQVAPCRHKKNQREYKKGLDDYYNFALSFIPQDEWLIKIDVDQIYDFEKLKQTFSYPKTKDDMVYYFRLNLHCFHGKIYIEKNNPISVPCDHWLICNRRLHFIEDIQEETDEEIFSWELLKIPFKYNAIPANLNTWHFPVMKESRRILAKLENYVHITKYKEVIPQEYFMRIESDMLDEDRILSHLLNNGEKNEQTTY
ncbi:hypothetical protein [uncultured Helicobacter sp.]|uniref:hypothetical protein n=1 Tax=uncultured Helicobacter sp. TaxID=175537 RepID=UPI00261D0F52|nr:hypothetical protein [uncultured Helicobacter sp.]